MCICVPISVKFKILVKHSCKTFNSVGYVDMSVDSLLSFSVTNQSTPTPHLPNGPITTNIYLLFNP